MKISIALLFGMFFFRIAAAQDIAAAANTFLNSLSAAQRSVALYPFDTDERYNYFYVPRERKGLAIGEMNEQQQSAAFALVRTCLSERATHKVEEIISLENVLKALEHRGNDDHYRDPLKYYFTVFGVPGEKNIWGWRIEGHHISFNFSVAAKKLVAGTPGFLGANPAIVKEGSEKGKQVLKEETDMGFAMVQLLPDASLKKAILPGTTPGEIITGASRKAMIEHPAGLSFAEMNSREKQQLLQLISLYIHRFTRLFADDMLKEIQRAGLDNLRFAWAGPTMPAEAKPFYYRIQGPTLIIEYDNSQNNANHVHTVVRDLLHDFGGDELLMHYRKEH